MRGKEIFLTIAPMSGAACCARLKKRRESSSKQRLPSEARAKDEKLNHHRPVCVIVKLFPAMVTVVEREPVEFFAFAVKTTLLLPVTVVLGVKLSQETFSVARHEQPVAVVTGIVTLPPVAVKVAVKFPIVNVHGTPAWVTENERPAISIVPVREAVLVFAATE